MVIAGNPGGSSMERRDFLLSGLAGSLAAAAPAAFAQEGRRTPDVIYVPTPQEVVDGMLKLARVGRNDIVYDLGCGDGRIVVTAARIGARAVGIDIDPIRIREATENIRVAGVGDRAKLIEGDLFATDISEATVVTLYLLSRLNLKLRPKLLKELRPGTRIVSHAFDMDDWKPVRTETIGSSNIHLWTVPGRKA
jgi:SAM-dependent methyltransferase